MRAQNGFYSLSVTGVPVDFKVILTVFSCDLSCLGRFLRSVLVSLWLSHAGC